MWLQKFRKRKGQVCVIFLMLLTSTLLMAGSLGIFTSLIQPYEEFVEDTDAPSVRAILYEEGQEEKNVQKLEGLEEVERVIPLKRYMVEEKVTYQEKAVNETIALVEYQEEAFAKIRMIQGENKKPKDQECLMPYALANSLGMKVGEQLSIKLGDTKNVYTVCGFYTAPYSCNILYQSEIIVAQLPEGATQTISYSIYGKDSYSGQDIVDAYVEANNGIMDGRFDTIEDVVSNITLNEKILGGILLALSVIAFLVCVVMIRFLLKNALYNDRKTIAVYKTIGYHQQDILKMYMKFYMSIAFAGTLVGAVASPILSSSFIKPAFRNIGLERTSISWWPRLLVMAGVLLLIALQVVLGVRKWKKVKPVVVLNDRESTLGIKKKNSKWKGSMDFSPMHMALRLIQRNKKSTIYVIITCFLSIYMVNFAIVAYTNVSTMPENNYYWLGFDEHDVSLITLNPTEFQENCESVAKLPEVERLVMNKFDFHASIKWQKGLANPNIECMVYNTYEGLSMPIVEGRNPKADNEIVVGNLLANELHKQIGDYIDLYFGTDKKVSLLIVGTFQSFMNMGRCVRLLGDTIVGAGVDFNYSDASVYLKDECTPQKFVDTYAAEYSDRMKMQKRTEKYDEMLDEICDPQLAAIGPFISIVLVIGCLNIICIIYLQNVTNRRKYAIYKSIGYSVSHLIRMNMWYVGTIAVASVICAVPIFMVAYPKIMTLSMSMFGFAKYPVFYEPKIMFFGNLALLVLFLLSALLTSKSLRGSQLKELAQE